jgi:uncharacterized protein (TIGR02145 family)
MKKKNWFYTFIPVSIGIILFAIYSAGCKKSSDNTVPALTTSAVTSIGSTSAVCGGNITSDGGSSVTSRGVCWSTSDNPTTADHKTSDFTGTGNFASLISGLSPQTPYYVKAYATNSSGTAYGEVRAFTTLPLEAGTVVDFDGNVYHTITIESQTWMVESLKVTHYRNGDTIAHGIGKKSENMITPQGQYWNYRNSDSLGKIYGRLYNNYAVTDPRFIAPLGWRVATDADWNELASKLQPDSTVGGKLKETGTKHWFSPNIGATNETGFTALPGGSYNPLTGSFTFFGYGTSIWTSTEGSYNSYAFGRSILNNSGYLNRGESPKVAGMSVRCIRGD